MDDAPPRTQDMAALPEETMPAQMPVPAVKCADTFRFPPETFKNRLPLLHGFTADLLLFSVYSPSFCGEPFPFEQHLRIVQMKLSIDPV